MCHLFYIDMTLVKLLSKMKERGPWIIQNNNQWPMVLSLNGTMSVYCVMLLCSGSRDKKGNNLCLPRIHILWHYSRVKLWTWDYHTCQWWGTYAVVPLVFSSHCYFTAQPGMPLEHGLWSLFPLLKGHLSSHLQEAFPNEAKEEDWFFSV